MIAFVCTIHLCTRLLLLVPEQCQERDTGDLDDLEANTWQITDGVPTSAETRDEDLIVLLNKVQTTVSRNKGCDLLPILDELHTAGLSNGRVRLLGLDANTLEDNALRMRSTTEGVGLQGSSGVLPRVLLVVPFLLAAMRAQLARAAHSRRLSVTHGCFVGLADALFRCREFCDALVARSGRNLRRRECARAKDCKTPVPPMPCAGAKRACSLRVGVPWEAVDGDHACQPISNVDQFKLGQREKTEKKAFFRKIERELSILTAVPDVAACLSGTLQKFPAC